MRSRRCQECGTRFYTAENTPLCQHCAGTYDPGKQHEVDAEIVTKANTARKLEKPQIVDIRSVAEHPKPETRKKKS